MCKVYDSYCLILKFYYAVNVVVNRILIVMGKYHDKLFLMYYLVRNVLFWKRYPIARESFAARILVCWLQLTRESIKSPK